MKQVTKFKKLGLGVRQFAPNHTIVFTDIGNAFISYDSIVAFRARGTGEITLGLDWDYSRTTMKYLGQWLGMNAKQIREAITRGEMKVEEL